jgi:DNA polymerase I-like protein with 3'-5' exonuclease and polymerase domains
MRKLNIIALDGETYYKPPEYSLKHMSTDRYIRDPRFQLQCLAVHSPTMQVAVPREHVPHFLAGLDQETTAVIAQHAQFDGGYLWHAYGWRPAFWFDTLSMSRALHGLSVRHSLAELCTRYRLPPKSVRYGGFEGKRYEDMDQTARQNQLDDCYGDAARTWDLAAFMLPRIPWEELRIIDMTVRMFTEPVLYGDQSLLTSLIAEEKRRKAELLDALKITEADLASDDKFEALLEDRGVEIEYKPAKSKRGEKGCFAVNDEYFKRMLADSDPLIRELFTARAEVKSTIQQTRAERYLEMAQSGPIRAYYYFYGARNARFAGGDDTNLQNLPSRGKNGTGLRRAIQAPKRHVLVIPDLGQIECRTLVTSAGQFDKVQAFRQRRDLYCESATGTFGRTITPADKLERQCGKTQVLQLGYGSGWRKYQMTIKRMTGLDLSEEEAERHVNFYRDDNTAIAGHRPYADNLKKRAGGYWQEGERWLGVLERYQTEAYYAPVEPGQPSSDQPLFTIYKQKIILPNGLMLHFDGVKKVRIRDTRFEKEGRPLEEYKDRKIDYWGFMLPTLSGQTKFYGGKLVQNINSALARLMLTQAELRVLDRAPWCKIALHTHDDAGFVCRDDRGDELKAIVDEEFTRPPPWLPNIPLSVESQIRRDYAK